MELCEGKQTQTLGPFPMVEAGKLRKKFGFAYENEKSEVLMFGKEFEFMIDVESSTDKVLLNNFRIFVDRKRK